VFPADQRTRLLQVIHHSSPEPFLMLAILSTADHCLLKE
jgi:hypothetical protein